ncbi:MAG: PHP domain-containing protein, partial [Holdemanella sp.]|nr:PHP domain-containing protein [Holdemanella sp.]
MKVNTIDLHMHSCHSLDGEKSVQELVDIAKESGVDVIAIADHNTTKAYKDEVDLKGVTIIPAIELDCQFQGKDFHILGYGIDPMHPVWDEICESVDTMEKNSGLARLEIITKEMGIQVDKKEEVRDLKCIS